MNNYKEIYVKDNFIIIDGLNLDNVIQDDIMDIVERGTKRNDVSFCRIEDFHKTFSKWYLIDNVDIIEDVLKDFPTLKNQKISIWEYIEDEEYDNFNPFRYYFIIQKESFL